MIKANMTDPWPDLLWIRNMIFTINMYTVLWYMYFVLSYLCHPFPVYWYVTNSFTLFKIATLPLGQSDAYDITSVKNADKINSLRPSDAYMRQY